MIVRSLVPAALIALAAVFAGCNRSATRRDPGLAVAPPPADRGAQASVARPLPPPPPAQPPINPPTQDALAGAVPPLPGGEAPVAVPDSPTGVVRAGGIPAEPVSLADDERKPILERIRERREERKERREQRRNPDKGKEKDEDKPKQPDPPPAPKPADTPPPPATNPPTVAVPPGGPTSGLAAVRKVVDASAKRYADVTDFECRLVKQEVVKGKQLPKEEMVYRFRKQPLSVYMKVTGESGHGREVMYVQGQFGDKMHVVTGKGDSRFAPAGFRIDMKPDDPRATEKSRQRISEAGFGRTLTSLTKSMDAAENGQTGAVKPLGQVKRPEYPYPLEGIEVTLRPGDDASMPKGGKREIFFDPKADSPSYMLPVLILATEPDGKQVEYYCFDQFRLPAGTTDADWNPARLGKK